RKGGLAALPEGGVVLVISRPGARGAGSEAANAGARPCSLAAVSRRIGSSSALVTWGPDTRHTAASVVCQRPPMDQNALPRTSAPPRRLPVRLSSRRLGLYVFFASLTMFFAAGIVAYVITRSQSTNWRIETTPRSPAGLWLSTALVVSISAVLESAR